LQAIKNWLSNASKFVARDAHPDAGDSGQDDDEGEGEKDEADEQPKTRGRGKKVKAAESMKSYNTRSVVKVLFPELVDKEFNRLVDEGVPKMQAYQPALTSAIGQLSKEDLEKCVEKVRALKQEDWPKELQMT
jgi:hypothetical protein